MRSIGLMSRIAMAGVFVVIMGFAAVVTAAGSVAAAHGPTVCATVRVVARPNLNTQAGSDETIRNEIRSCAHKPEVVQIKQRLSLSGAFSGNFELSPGGTVEITQHIPYVCCGTYYATDRVFSTTGRLLHTARTSWTFA